MSILTKGSVTVLIISIKGHSSTWPICMYMYASVTRALVAQRSFAGQAGHYVDTGIMPGIMA